MSTQHGELNKHVLPADSVLTPVFEQLRTFNTSQNDERKHDEKTRILVDITYQLPYLLEHLDGLVGSEIVALGYVADFLSPIQTCWLMHLGLDSINILEHLFLINLIALLVNS